MSKRLFVDVDDTLVLYDLNAPNPYGIYQGVPYKLNDKLIEGIKKYHIDNPDELIIVWSGGGREYAEMWINNIGLNNIAYPLEKSKETFHLIQDNSIVIDDMEDMFKRTYTPFNWPEEN